MFEEKMAENSPNLMKNIDVQMQGVHQAPTRINPNRYTLKHITPKMLKSKEKTLQREKNDSPHIREPQYN